jgi:adenosine deaminase
MTFASMPKVELHLHHEAAAPPDFIRQIAAEKKIDISHCFDDQGNFAFRDFSHFIEVYDGATKALTTPEDFQRLTYRALEETAKSGVIYCETFLSPDFCGGSDLVAWKEFLAAIKEGADAAEKDFGIVHRGVITCLRHEGPEKAIPAARCAAETAGDYITGFGMAGAEMAGRPGDFAYSFDMAREAGLRLTCHAGEWGGPDMVADTLRDLKVERIGHGINAIKDDALVDQMAENGVVLEVCPGSNVVLKAVTGWDAHPIAKLRERGVKVTVSTDDPPFFATTMTKEFENLNRTFGWGRPEFDEMNTNAIEAAFCDDATKAAIVKRLEAAKND